MVLLFPIGMLGALPASAAAPDHEDALQAFSRDVFVIVGSTLREPDDTTADDASHFNGAGVPLELTWGQWKQARATSTAHRIGNDRNARTDFHLTLSGLAPGGVYSVFYGTLLPDSENPLCPGVERSLALTAQDPTGPDPSSFVADAFGQATYFGRVNGDPMTAYQVFIFIIYHLDGQTWHPLPNHGEFNTQGSGCRSSFGEDAMRQLVIWQKF
jgi:hypothetical protein